MVAKMKEKLEEVSQETGVSYTVEQLVNILPGAMSPELLDLLEESCKAAGYSCQRMLSGATHDTPPSLRRDGYGDGLHPQQKTG